MGLTSDARLLVTTKRRVGGVGVIAVGPDASSLNGAAHAIAGIRIARPHSGTQAIERIVSDLQRFALILEGRDRHNRAENLLLEDAHLVIPAQHCWLHVIAVLQSAIDVGAAAAGEKLGA